MYFMGRKEHRVRWCHSFLLGMTLETLTSIWYISSFFLGTQIWREQQQQRRSFIDQATQGCFRAGGTCVRRFLGHHSCSEDLRLNVVCGLNRDCCRPGELWEPHEKGAQLVRENRDRGLQTR